MEVKEIIDALRKPFPEATGWDTGGGIVCPVVTIGDNGGYAFITDAEEADRSLVMVGYYAADLDEALGNEGEIVLTAGTMEEAIAMLFALRAREEILGDFETFEATAGGVAVETFTDLQSLCDANMYVERAFTFYTERHRAAAAGGLDVALPFVNKVIENIEALGTFGKTEVA